MPTKIYLATPYSHPDKNIELKRFEAVNKKAAELMQRGYIVFSPVSHSHPINKFTSIKTDWEFWKRQDFQFIEWADELWVLEVDGWDNSVGVLAEIERAKKLGMPVIMEAL